MSSVGDFGPDAKAAVRAARMRRGMFLLPSLFTAGSIGAGFFAITQTIDSLTSKTPAHNIDIAAIAIGLAIPFDALDGRIARMTNTTSEFGKELDSLADAITFGVAPCLLAWVWGFHSIPASVNPELSKAILQVGTFVCFLYLICGASRLARFNSSHNAQPRNPGRTDRKYFVGMPIPAAAGMVAATVHFSYGYTFPPSVWWLAIPWMLLVALLGFLMVSTWRFWSGKEINFARRQPFQLIALIAIVLFIIIRYSSGVLFFVALAYMFSGIWARAAYSWSRRRRRQKFAPEPESIPKSRASFSGPSFKDEYVEHIAPDGEELVDRSESVASHELPYEYPPIADPGFTTEHDRSSRPDEY